MNISKFFDDEVASENVLNSMSNFSTHQQTSQRHISNDQDIPLQQIISIIHVKPAKPLSPYKVQKILEL